VRWSHSRKNPRPKQESRHSHRSFPPAIANSRARALAPCSYSPSPTLSTAKNASWGISTRPMRFMRFLPSFCFSSSLRLRVMSPP